MNDLLPLEPEDPATSAFRRLEGELALMRRAVEHLATEKAEISVPDYSKTLGEIAKRLGAIAEKPAMQLTPETLGERIEAAAYRGRSEDKTTIHEARQRFDEGTRAMRQIAGTAHTAHEQRRRLYWAAGGGLLVGLLLWSFLPGAVARALPTSWRLPERLATRMLGEPSRWEAGVRLMKSDSQTAWRDLRQAADLVRENREIIEECQADADKLKKTQICSIEIGSRGQSKSR